MHYVGGKFRQGKLIAEYINKCKPINYAEPFCGMLNVAKRVNAKLYLLNDLNSNVIDLFKHLQNGNELSPNTITPDEYQEYKSLSKLNQLPLWQDAYIGFGASFGGKYWGGYARNKSGDDTTNTLPKAQSSLNKLSKLFVNNINWLFVNQNYKDLDLSDYDTIYLDPPYRNTLGYSGAKKSNKIAASIDWDEFDNWCIDLAKQGKNVFLTEYHVFENYQLLHTWNNRNELNHAFEKEKTTKVEHLYRVKV